MWSIAPHSTTRVMPPLISRGQGQCTCSLLWHTMEQNSLDHILFKGPPPKWNPAHHRACAVSCIAASYFTCLYFSLHKQLKDEVCSPAGTSIQAIQVLEKAGLRGLFMEAVQTACKRAAELSRIENGETQDYALKRRWTMYKSRTSTSFMIISPTHSSFIHAMSVILNKFVELLMVWYNMHNL